MVSADGPSLVCYPYHLPTHGIFTPGLDSPNGAPSPSTLFARRLMHFCSVEVVAQASNSAVPAHDVPPSSKTSFFPTSPTHSKSQKGPTNDTVELEDLVDRLDFITHPERAYE